MGAVPHEGGTQGDQAPGGQQYTKPQGGPYAHDHHIAGNLESPVPAQPSSKLQVTLIVKLTLTIH